MLTLNIFLKLQSIHRRPVIEFGNLFLFFLFNTGNSGQLLFANNWILVLLSTFIQNYIIRMASNGGPEQRSGNGVLDEKALLQRQVDGLATDRSSSGSAQTTKNLVICVGGIYASLYASSIIREYTYPS